MFVPYSIVTQSGSDIPYTISGYSIRYSLDVILILRVLFSSGLESNVKLNSTGNGLMTLILQNRGKVINVSTDVYIFL